ncbi:uncharacterized protein MKK02DRAFT_41749 [Dioszegia hungarica]|uniref:Uncharacterized protein n=1 Tax=Dioszegia hungarica TaxID=4972 RepID=A0AA38LXK4_9TREE|nr:uncharacterized protein MKK02DRAFT_41749 [Dioszegia hungarica]KAI9638728.1 hypothetical protein MKK02DRAFT_41749 [Dioszegia hungarica]
MSRVLLGRFAKFYNGEFDRRPTRTLIVTNGILNSVADLCAQASEQILYDATSGDPVPRYDPLRTLRFAAYGMALGPLIGKWMHLLETRIPMRMGKPGNGLQLFKRVLADQVIMAPAGMALFVAAMGTMEGKSVQQIKDKFSGMYFPGLIANWKVWPAIQTINFKLMPLAYRVPFQSTCGIAWTVFLSLLNKSSKGG